MFVALLLDGLLKKKKWKRQWLTALAKRKSVSAIDAKNCLVDIYGGLNDAVACCKKTGLDNYRIKELPGTKDPIQEILEGYER